MSLEKKIEELEKQVLELKQMLLRGQWEYLHVEFDKLSELGYLGWQLCGKNEGKFIVKRRIG